MQSPTPLTKTILRLARTAEQASGGAGLTLLNTYQATIGAAIAQGGQKMVSASTASKSFSFADGYSMKALNESLDEAFGLWATLDSDQLSALLDSRPVRQARLAWA